MSRWVSGSAFAGIVGILVLGPVPAARSQVPADRQVASRVARLPAHYRALFERGTRWTYEGRFANPLAVPDDKDLMPFRMTCEVATVKAQRHGLVSEWRCDPAPGPVVRKVWPRYFAATAKGLAMSPEPLDLTRRPGKSFGAFLAHPVEGYYDEEGYTSGTVRRKVDVPNRGPVGAWCEYFSSGYSDSQVSNEICLAPGIGLVVFEDVNYPEAEDQPGWFFKARMSSREAAPAAPRSGRPGAP